MTTEHVFDASWRLSARTVAMTVRVAFFEGQTLRYSINICLQKFDYKVDMIIQNRQNSWFLVTCTCGLPPHWHL